MTIVGLWRYGNWRHVATGCIALVVFINSVVTDGMSTVFTHLSIYYYYYYYIRLTAFFQDNLGKSAPEKEAIVDFT